VAVGLLLDQPLQQRDPLLGPPLGQQFLGTPELTDPINCQSPVLDEVRIGPLAVHRQVARLPLGRGRLVGGTGARQDQGQLGGRLLAGVRVRRTAREIPAGALQVARRHRHRTEVELGPRVCRVPLGDAEELGAGLVGPAQFE
jgi:hypothetical protein